MAESHPAPNATPPPPPPSPRRAPAKAEPGKLDWLAIGVSLGAKIGVTQFVGLAVGIHIGFEIANQGMRGDVDKLVHDTIENDWLGVFLYLDIAMAFVAGGICGFMAKRNPLLNALVMIVIAQGLGVAYYMIDQFPVPFALKMIVFVIPAALLGCLIGMFAGGEVRRAKHISQGKV